jgi:hypothetical protein
MDIRIAVVAVVALKVTIPVGIDVCHTAATATGFDLVRILRTAIQQVGNVVVIGVAAQRGDELGF